jgi:hypothetical protein
MNDIREIVFDGTATTKLEESTRLWRYVPLKSLFLYLNKKAFIPSVETLRKKDPFEAVFYHDAHSAIFNGALIRAHGQNPADRILKWIYDARLPEWKKKSVHSPNTDSINYNNPFFRDAYFEFQRSTHYAWCWFTPTANSESAAMWNLYGAEGAVVITTLGKLRAMLQKTGRQFEYSRMNYVHAQDGMVANIDELYPGGSPENIEYVLRPFFVKRAEYDSEKEVRFITVAADSITGGITLNLEPKDWIEEIRLSPVLAADEEKSLQTTIHKFYEGVPCARSGLLRDRNDEEVKTIIDQYLNAFDPKTPSELTHLLPT